MTYVHLLFDQHEIVCGNGLFSESYHPRCETLEGFDADARAEILQVIGGGAGRLWSRSASRVESI